MMRGNNVSSSDEMEIIEQNLLSYSLFGGKVLIAQP